MKPQLLILHGALGSQKQFKALSELLSITYEVYTMDFSGHGKREQRGQFSLNTFRQDVSEFLDFNNLNEVTILGYSMGGYVALTMAVSQDIRLRQIITLGTKIQWTPEIALLQSSRLNPEIIEKKVPSFASYLNGLHTACHWKTNMSQTAKFIESLGHTHMITEDFNKINIPVVLMVGDLDTMVTTEETRHTSELIRNSQFHVIKGVEHAIEKIDSSYLAQHILNLNIQ